MRRAATVAMFLAVSVVVGRSSWAQEPDATVSVDAGVEADGGIAVDAGVDVDAGVELPQVDLSTPRSAIRAYPTQRLLVEEAGEELPAPERDTVELGGSPRSQGVRGAKKVFAAAYGDPPKRRGPVVMDSSPPTAGFDDDDGDGDGDSS